MKELDEKEIQKIDYLNKLIKELNSNRKETEEISYKLKEIKINNELKQKVLEGIDTTYNDIEKARHIYIKLGKLLTYNETFIYLKQDITDKIGKTIYERPIEEITLENNEIICKTWAELYSALLNEIGIDSSVAMKDITTRHCYVKINIGETQWIADATQEVKSKNHNYYLTDLTRIKLGLPTGGFYSSNSELDLEKIDKKIKYNKEDSINRYENIIKNNRSNLSLNISIQLVIIEKILESKGLKGIESYAYLKILLNIFLKEEINNNVVRYYNCGRIKNNHNEYKSGPLINININNENIYFIYDNMIGLKIIDRDIIEILINNEEFVSISKEPIRGIKQKTKILHNN